MYGIASFRKQLDCFDVVKCISDTPYVTGFKSEAFFQGLSSLAVGNYLQSQSIRSPYNIIQI